MRALSRRNGRSIYDVFSRWNNVYTQAIADKKTLNASASDGKGFPLLEALDGFTSVAPAKDATPSVVIAAVPLEQKVGMRSELGGAVTALVTNAIQCAGKGAQPRCLLIKERG